MEHRRDRSSFNYQTGISRELPNRRASHGERGRSSTRRDDGGLALGRPHIAEGCVEGKQRQDAAGVSQSASRRSTRVTDCRQSASEEEESHAAPVDEGKSQRKQKPPPQMPAARRTAMSKLGVGDHVKAQDPSDCTWVDATVHEIRSNGIVVVRWQNPGKFSPLGDVYAEQVRIVSRGPKTQEESQEESLGGSQEDSSQAMPDVELPDGLVLGDECFAFGHSAIVGKQWFRTRLLSLHSKYTDQVRVEYIATRDGQTALSLPEPRKAFVPLYQIRREAPAEEEGPDVKSGEASQTHKNEDSLVVDSDLKCSVCHRPDDEALMLICDCKAGFHTYCLTPPLDAVPEGEWRCPSCAA